MEYQYRLAGRADKDAIVAFVNAHWGERHPLMNREEYFAYYYGGDTDGLRFALCEQAGALAAVAGYIPASQGPAPDIWVSIWVADRAMRGSGLELMAKLPGLTGCGTLACNNIRPETMPFYDFLGYTTGRMGHYYRLADKKEYRLARVAHKTIYPVGGGARLARLESAEALGASGFAPPPQNPYKDLWYIGRRYFAYPGHSYEVYGVWLPEGRAPAGLLAARTVNANGAAVLRIADFIGPEALLPECGAAIDGLMRQKQAEYADFYCAGIGAATMQKAGFAARTPEDLNILPNYLNPPVFENTEYYYFTSRPAGFRMCKADGDQDRPNLL